MDPDPADLFCAWEITSVAPLPPASTFASQVEAAFAGENPIVCTVREDDAESMVFLFTANVSGKMLGCVLGQCLRGTATSFTLMPMMNTEANPLTPSKLGAINAAMTTEIIEARQRLAELHQSSAEQLRTEKQRADELEQRADEQLRTEKQRADEQQRRAAELERRAAEQEQLQKRKFDAIIEQTREDTQKLTSGLAQQMSEIIAGNSKRLRAAYESGSA